VRLVANAVAGANHQRRIWLHADDAACPLGESRQVKPVSAADVYDVGTTPVDSVGQCCPERPVGVDGVILPLVNLGPVPDIRAGQHAPVGHRFIVNLPRSDRPGYL
jgi:hypothetical protein